MPVRYSRGRRKTSLVFKCRGQNPSVHRPGLTKRFFAPGPFPPEVVIPSEPRDLQRGLGLHSLTGLSGGADYEGPLNHMHTPCI